MEFLLWMFAIVCIRLNLDTPNYLTLHERIVHKIVSRFKFLSGESAVAGVFIGLCLIGWLLSLLLSMDLLRLMAGGYLIYVMCVSNVIRPSKILTRMQSKYPDQDKKALLETLSVLEGMPNEDNGQPNSILQDRIVSLHCSKFFLNVFVLSFYYLLLGWIGLALWITLYSGVNVSTSIQFKKLQNIVELPAALCAAVAYGLAGQLDALLKAVSRWSSNDYFDAVTLNEGAMLSALNFPLEMADDLNSRLIAVENIQIRGLYVWAFVMSLVVVF